MTSLGNKLKAIQILKDVMNNISDVVSEEDAGKLNTEFAVFNKRFEINKDEKGLYDLVLTKEFYALCTDIVKKEYTAKFMASMVTQIMFEE